MVRSDAEIHGGDFTGNGSFGLGGAILAIASRLTVGQSTFSGNEARVGGAIMSWGRPPRVNIWSEDDWTDLPRLMLSGVTFRRTRRAPSAARSASPARLRVRAWSSARTARAQAARSPPGAPRRFLRPMTA